LIVALTVLFVSIDQAATLTHRYSFDNDANDLVGGANGIISGNAYLTNGNLVLDGTNSSVRLPNDLFTNYDSISFETWFLDGAINSQTAQIYHFSGTQGRMNYSLFGQGAYFRGTVSNVVNLPAPAVGRTNHLIWTQDSVSQTARLYINGILAGENTGFTNTPILIGSTTTNLIGTGKTNTTALSFKGNILEFRTYQDALSPLDAAVLDAYGPEQPQPSPGTLQAVRVVVPSPTGPGALFRAGVFADFSSVTNVNISTQPDLVLTSDNTNVIAIAPDQRLQTVTLGVANVTALWQGFSNTLAVTVGVPQDIALLHRYGFNEKTNDWIVHDSVGGANGRLFNPLSGGFLPTGVFTGKGEMKLKGDKYDSGYVALPPGIISSLSEISVEAWVLWTNPSIGTSTAWQRIFDFGNYDPDLGRGRTYLFLTPATDIGSFTTKELLHFAITTNYNTAETPRLNWTNTLPVNVTSFVAVTYSPVRGVVKLYLNGVRVASDVAIIPLSGIIDTNNWLGRSQFTGDTYFGGRYNEFRIYSGLLSDSDVAADYAAGPDVVGVDYVLHDYASTNSLTITWGLSATNWYLQSSPTLDSGAVWSPVALTPLLQNGRYNITLPVSADAAFFRLHAP
jgi:hypothetical protein